MRRNCCGMECLMRHLMRRGWLVVVVAACLVWTRSAGGHCDALDGPVVLEAKGALEKGDVTAVLKWVRAEDEKAIREAFAMAVKVRALGQEAREVADEHFFETLVRLHRAGEGEAFSGLKPAGHVDPGIAAADRALKDGSPDRLAAELGNAVAAGLRERFERVTAAKARTDESVEAGRAYVAAYVEYIHFAERVRELTSSPAAEHHAMHAESR